MYKVLLNLPLFLQTYLKLCIPRKMDRHLTRGKIEISTIHRSREGLGPVENAVTSRLVCCLPKGRQQTLSCYHDNNFGYFMFGKYNGFVSKARVSACMYFLVLITKLLLLSLPISLPMNCF